MILELYWTKMRSITYWQNDHANRLCQLWISTSTSCAAYLALAQAPHCVSKHAGRISDQDLTELVSCGAPAISDVNFTEHKLLHEPYFRFTDSKEPAKAIWHVLLKWHLVTYMNPPSVGFLVLPANTASRHCEPGLPRQAYLRNFWWDLYHISLFQTGNNWSK